MFGQIVKVVPSLQRLQKRVFDSRITKDSYGEITNCLSFLGSGLSPGQLLSVVMFALQYIKVLSLCQRFHTYKRLPCGSLKRLKAFCRCTRHTHDYPPILSTINIITLTINIYNEAFKTLPLRSNDLSLFWLTT